MKFLDYPAKGSGICMAAFFVVLAAPGAGIIKVAALYGGAPMEGATFLTIAWLVIGMSFCGSYHESLINPQSGTVGLYLERLAGWLWLWPVAIVFAELLIPFKPKYAYYAIVTALSAAAYTGCAILAYWAWGGPNFWLLIAAFGCIGYALFFVLGYYEHETELTLGLMAIKDATMFGFTTLVAPFLFAYMAVATLEWTITGGLSRYLRGPMAMTSR